MIEMPPFARVDDKIFGFHQTAQKIAIFALNLCSARVIGRGAFGKFVKARRHFEKLVRVQIKNAQINRTAAIVFRAFRRIGDEFPLFGRDDFPEKFRDPPRAITVENYQTEIFFAQFLMNADDRFGGDLLKKSARLRVNLLCP